MTKTKNCRICKTELLKNWNYCPKCGGKTKEEKFEIKVDKIKYLVERQEGGDIVYKNFKSITEVSKYHANKQETIREKLGDFIGLNFGGLRIFSLLYHKPEYINEFFKVGKLLGYFATINGLKVIGKTEYLGQHYKSDAFWSFISNPKIQEMHMREWHLMKEGLLEFISADKFREMIRYHIKESPMSAFKLNKPLCFFELATECGFAEALSNVYWSGKETMCECVGDEYCEFEIILEKEYSEPNLKKFNKNELENLINQCVENIESKNRIQRKERRDTIHLMDDQVINYLLISPSP
ncbi:MAG: 4-vinyl reductase, partial [Candidatus Altiarchaeota archaeon]